MSDPDGIELMHSPKSLFEDNFHGVSGAGDCDDFTILAVSALRAKGFSPDIILAGTPRTPSHVYAEVNRVSFDLTRPRYGIRSNHKRHQKIKIQWV